MDFRDQDNIDEEFLIAAELGLSPIPPTRAPIFAPQSQEGEEETKTGEGNIVISL